MLLALLVLAAAGYVGSVVGPHFKSSAAPAASTTTTSKPPPSTTTSTIAHSSVSVVVANGTQQPNAAGHFSQILQQQGWNVGQALNATAAASTSTVYYASGQQQAAALVATALHLPASSVQPLTSTTPVASPSGTDVVVVIGPDLAGSGFPATTTT